MHTYIITEHLDYVALVLMKQKYSFTYDGINITFAAPEQFIKNLKARYSLMAKIHFYENKTYEYGNL